MLVQDPGFGVQGFVLRGLSLLKASLQKDFPIFARKNMKRQLKSSFKPRLHTLKPKLGSWVGKVHLEVHVTYSRYDPIPDGRTGN